jgi:hypothetical protein
MEMYFPGGTNLIRLIWQLVYPASQTIHFIQAGLEVIYVSSVSDCKQYDCAGPVCTAKALVFLGSEGVRFLSVVLFSSQAWQVTIADSVAKLLKRVNLLQFCTSIVKHSFTRRCATPSATVRTTPEGRSVLHCATSLLATGYRDDMVDLSRLPSSNPSSSTLVHS